MDGQRGNGQVIGEQVPPSTLIDELGRPTNDPTVRPVLNGMLTILIDPAKLGTDIAGDPQRSTRAHREVAGIHIGDPTWRQIVAAGRKVNVE